MPEKKSLPFARPAVGGAVLAAATLLWACSTVAAPAASSTTPTATAAPASAEAPAAAAPAAAPTVDMAHAKATFEAMCSGCHESALATDQRYDRKGWEQVIDRMYGFGLSATDEQAHEIVEYLAANYPAS